MTLDFSNLPDNRIFDQLLRTRFTVVRFRTNTLNVGCKNTVFILYFNNYRFSSVQLWTFLGEEGRGSKPLQVAPDCHLRKEAWRRVDRRKISIFVKKTSYKILFKTTRGTHRSAAYTKQLGFRHLGVGSVSYFDSEMYCEPDVDAKSSVLAVNGVLSFAIGEIVRLLHTEWNFSTLLNRILSFPDYKF